LKITAWRIFKKKHLATAFTGEGARRFGGRWNSKGVAVIYTSETISLAVLEILVHLQAPKILDAYLLAPVTFDEILVNSIARKDLPSGWRNDPGPSALQETGDHWVASGASAILRIPSVIVTTESNYLLNPAHRDFRRCVWGKPQPYKFDRRLIKS
jgi:RES domain-containing protein